MKQKMRVLIADNQARARQGMKALLGAWYQVDEFREAANGADAVQLAKEFKPDLILMDGRMPKMNGLEATRLIKAGWPAIKIIVLSMYPEIKDEALLVGADSFVSKSDSPEKLRETLIKVIGDREVNKEEKTV